MWTILGVEDVKINISFFFFFGFPNFGGSCSSRLDSLMFYLIFHPGCFMAIFFYGYWKWIFNRAKGGRSCHVGQKGAAQRKRTKWKRENGWNVVLSGAVQKHPSHPSCFYFHKNKSGQAKLCRPGSALVIIIIIFKKRNASFFIATPKYKRENHTHTHTEREKREEKEEK